MSADTRRPSTTERLKRELPMLGLSLLMGFLIWIIAATQTTEQFRMSVALRAAGLPENVQVTLSPPRVDVAVTLPTSLRDLVTPDDFLVTVDLSDAARRAGLGQTEEWSIPISLTQNVRATRDPRLLNEVILTDPYPATCIVTAQLVAEAIDIRPVLTGQLAQGLNLAEPPIVTPSRLWVTASRSALDDLQRSGEGFPTAPIDLSALSPGPHEFSRTPVLPEGFRAVGQRNPETGLVERVAPGTVPEITVSLLVQEDIVERRFTEVRPNLQRSFVREDLRITDTQPAQFTVTLRGPASALDRITAEEVVITVPLLASLSREGTSSLQVYANLAESVPAEIRDGLSVVGIEPAQVQITLEAVTPPPAPER